MNHIKAAHKINVILSTFNVRNCHIQVALSAHTANTHTHTNYDKLNVICWCILAPCCTQKRQCQRCQKLRRHSIRETCMKTCSLGVKTCVRKRITKFYHCITNNCVLLYRMFNSQCHSAVCIEIKQEMYVMKRKNCLFTSFYLHFVSAIVLLCSILLNKLNDAGKSIPIHFL